MANEDVQAAALLGCGTQQEQIEAVASALKGTRVEARVEGWMAAAELLDRATQRVPTHPESLRQTRVGMGAAAKLLREMLPDVLAGKVPDGR